MPDFPSSFNPWDYEPQVGDRVELYPRYYPRGVSVVTEAGGGRLSLRGAGEEFDGGMDDTLENWRRYGIRPAGSPEWRPEVGDHVRLSAGYRPEGIATVIDANGDQYTLQSLSNRPVTDFLDYWREMGMRPVSPSAEPPYMPRAGDHVTYGDSRGQRRTGIITSVQRCPACSGDYNRAGDDHYPGGSSETAWTVRINGMPSVHLSAYRNRGLELVSRPETTQQEGTEEPPMPDHSAAITRAIARNGYAYVPEPGDRVELDAWTFVTESVTVCTSCLPNMEELTVGLRPAGEGAGERWHHHLSTLLRMGLRPEGSERRPVPRTWELSENRAYELVRQNLDLDHYGSGAYWWDVLMEASAAARRVARGEGSPAAARVHLTSERVLRLAYRRSMRFFLDDPGSYYDSGGFDEDGYNPGGFDRDGYDVTGFDRDGYSREGLDRDGYSRDGYDEDGYNREGYDSEGYDRDGDPRYESRGRALHSYDYTPELTFYKTDDDPHPETFYGVELEMTSGCSSAEMRYIREAGQREALFYPKSDGSVDGFELNVHPMTWAWASANFPWVIVEKLEELGSSVYPDGNGIHVHVSRAGFSGPAHLFRWMKFFYRNQRSIERIAGRRASSWAAFRPEHNATQKAHALNQMKQRGYAARVEEWRNRRYTESAVPQPENPAFEQDDTTGSRYSAINTTNSHTVEVRVFASTTDPHTFAARVGLVAATVEYTRQLNARQVIAGGWDWEAFREWVLDNANTYPDLAADEAEQRKLEAMADREAEAKRERARLRKEWLNAEPVLTFAEFLAQREPEPVV